MIQTKVSPYGSWKSPITSELIVKESVGLSQIMLDGADAYWIELRPPEGGRQVVVHRAADGKLNDVTPADFNARTRVHEYGGGDYAEHTTTTHFSNFIGQQTHSPPNGASPQCPSPISVETARSTPTTD